MTIQRRGGKVHYRSQPRLSRSGAGHVGEVMIISEMEAVSYASWEEVSDTRFWAASQSG